MARSDSGVVQPQRRGLIWAVGLGCFLVLSAVLLFSGRGKKADDSDPDAAVTANGVLDQIGSGPHKTATVAGAQSKAQLDHVDKETMATKAKGAVVGTPKIVSANSVQINGQTFVLWAVLAPMANATCYTNGQPWKCGIESYKALNQLISQHTLLGCYDKGVDANNRTVAQCYIGVEDIGGKLVRAGWVLADLDIDHEYNGQQSDARSHRKGLWSSQFRMEEFMGN